jgi:SEC-C motif-containing protein
MKALDGTSPCPCGRLAQPQGKPVAYAQCCGAWLEAEGPTGPFAPDAQALMRSRYSAFVLERAPYLLATWQASHRPAVIVFEPGVRWLGLEVRRYAVTDATHAVVEFVARQKPAGAPAVRLYERSRFVREDGRWLYVNGDAL